MILLNKKRVMECEEEEIDEHDNENALLISRILNLKNYECFVLSKYLDVGHKKNTTIQQSELHEILEIIEGTDIKNGFDFYIDDGLEYIVINLYGQSYELKKNSYTTVQSIKILPYDTNKTFINIVPAILKIGDVQISNNQFELNYLLIY